MNSSCRFTRRSTLVLRFSIGLFFIISSSFAFAQSLDENYSAKIKEYTTEPFFLTELVDHLPASATVPTPEKVLGYVIGTPEKLTYTKDIYRYLREHDLHPYIYTTDDYGATWRRLTDGTNGIPDSYPTRVVREDPEREGLLYAGTEFGLFVSFDDGRSWQPLQQNLPATPVTDIRVHRGDQRLDLIVAQDVRRRCELRLQLPDFLPRRLALDEVRPARRFCVAEHLAQPVGDVGADGHTSSADRLDLGHGLVGLGTRPGVVDGDRAALARQPEGDRAAEAGGAAGNERDAAGDIHAPQFAAARRHRPGDRQEARGQRDHCHR